MLDSLANQNYDAKLFIEIVQAAFIQATVLSSDLESKFKEFLLSVSGNVPFPDTHQADIARLQLLSTLSPMGRQSYEWAETALNAAEENSKGTIRDAGMISLGFFRIFELELNSRILIPLRKDLKVVDLLDANWQLVQKQLEDLKTTETKNKIKSIEKCIKFWSRLVPELKKVLSGESSGLELGSLEYLLSKTSNIDGPDQEFKEFLVSLLSQRFTEIGLAAHRSGALSELINGTVRERFRNQVNQLLTNIYRSFFQPSLHSQVEINSNFKNFRFWYFFPVVTTSNCKEFSLTQIRKCKNVNYRYALRSYYQLTVNCLLVVIT